MRRCCLLSLKSEEMKESLAMVANGSRKKSSEDDQRASITSSHTNVSAPAKELLALQNVKSLSVMIRDGLKRHQESHGVLTTDTESTTIDSKSVETFRGTSLDDLNEIGYAELTPYEENVLKRDYSAYEYTITNHPVSQEGGGVSEKKRVELPYPAVSLGDAEIERTVSGELFQMKVSNEPLPKNEDELKVLDGKTLSLNDDERKKLKRISVNGRKEQFMNRQMSSADEIIRGPNLAFFPRVPSS